VNCLASLGSEDIPGHVVGVERIQKLIAAAAGLDDGQCAGGRIEPDLDIVVDSVAGLSASSLPRRYSARSAEWRQAGIRRLYVSPRLGIFSAFGSGAG